MRRPAGTAALQRPLPVAGTPLFDWKGIVHCHSYLSHDSDGTVNEIRAACDAARIDFLVMTDHQTDASVRDGLRGRIGDTLFVVGAEVRTPQCTILAFPLKLPLRRWQSAEALVAEAARQGAIAFVAHVELAKRPDVLGIAGLEIVNLHAGALATNAAGALFAGFFMPLSTLMQQFCRRDERVFSAWDQALSNVHPCTPVGGNDAHANVRLFGPLGGTIGTYREVFLTLSTHILAETLDETGLVEALRAGRSYVAFDIFGEGAGFDFRAVDGDSIAMGGATVESSPTLRLEVSSPGPGLIRVFRDGIVIDEADRTTWQQNSPTPGVYRVEVRRHLDLPWIFSSSIRVIEVVRHRGRRPWRSSNAGANRAPFYSVPSGSTDRSAPIS